MKNWGSTPSLKNLVGVHPMNIHKKFEVNLCSGSSRKTKKVHDNDDDNNNEDGQRVIAMVTLTR